MNNKDLDAIREKYSNRLEKWSISSGEMLNDIENLLDEIDRLEDDLCKKEMTIDLLIGRVKYLEDERDRAIEAIQSVCKACGFNDDPCTEEHCFGYKWRRVLKKWRRFSQT